MSTLRVEVVEMGTGKVVKSFDVTGKPERQIDKLEMGLLRNMDLERFSVQRTPAPPKRAP